MKKELLNLGEGKLVVSEEAGNFEVAINASVEVGGGDAAGVVTAEGAGKVVLHGKQAFDLGMKLLEAHSPAPIAAIEAGAAAIVDQVIDKV
jgi:hypothetical protein